MHESWFGVLFVIFSWKLTIRSSVANSKGDGFNVANVNGHARGFIQAICVYFPCFLGMLNDKSR